MRGFWLIVVTVAVVGARPARAGLSTVVVMSEPARAGELGSALQVALTGRSVAVATVPSPEGELRLDRAAAAQRAADRYGADAALWIDRAPDGIEVCAVSQDGRYFRHAPLIGTESARTFAAIATSLLDELLLPPDAPGIDVHVDIDIAPAAAAMPRRVAVAMPSPAEEAAPAVVADAAPLRSDRTLVEFGPMLSPLSAGIEAEVAFPIGSAWRLGAVVGANTILVDRHDIVLLGALEVRHVGIGTRHLDLGFLAGEAGSPWRSGRDEYVGVRIGVTWEGLGSGTQVSLVPLITATGLPIAYASLRWELPI